MQENNKGYKINFTIPQGPTGPQGITGPTGEPGPTGPTGTISSAYGSFYVGGDKSYDMVRFGSHIIELNTYNNSNNITFNADENSVTIKEAGTYLVIFKVPVSLTSGNSIVVGVNVNNNADLSIQKTISQTDGTVDFFGFDLSYYPVNTKVALYLGTSNVSTVKVISGAKLILIKL